MKGKVFFILLYFIVLGVSSLYSQDNTEPVYFDEKNQLSIDSLYKFVYNPKISYKEKTNVFLNLHYFISNAQQEKQKAIFNKLIEDGKKEHNIDGIVNTYMTLAVHNLTWNKPELYQAYMDSADMYAEEVEDKKVLLYYYYNKGFQDYNIPYGRKEGFMYYEKAIDYLSYAGSDTLAASTTTYNIVGDLSIKPDTAFMTRIAIKIENLLKKRYDALIEFNLCNLKSDLYKCYYDGNKQEAMLDSAIYYYQKLIDTYYNNNLNEEYEYHVHQGYLLIAEYNFLKEKPNLTIINEYIDKVKNGKEKDDIYIKSRLNYVEALYLYRQKKYSEAEKKIVLAEEYLKQMYQEEGLYSELPIDEIKNADLHTQILCAQGKYKDAVVYNRIKNDIKLKVRNDETRELEFQYSTEKEERKIDQLKATNANQRKSTTMFIAIAVLLVIAITLLWLWFHTAKRSLERRSALIKAEKEEAELNLKIKEQQAVKAQLEKYEVLSDYRIKEMELEGKNKALEQLLKDKETLDKKIDEYTKKINEYENANDKKQDDSDNTEDKEGDAPLLNLIVEDITKLIKKRLPDKKDYLRNLERIDESFISTLKKAYNGNLSIPYLKYCVCFAIGLEIGEVSECFSIEQASVHMVRYRLKKKFGLDNNDDLDVYLRRMNKNLTDNDSTKLPSIFNNAKK